MATALNTITTFLRVSPAQQLPVLGMFAPMTASNTHMAIENFSQGYNGLGIAAAFGALTCTMGLLFGEYLAWERMREYRKVRRALEENGWDEGLIERKSHT